MTRTPHTNGRFGHGHHDHNSTMHTDDAGSGRRHHDDAEHSEEGFRSGRYPRDFGRRGPRGHGGGERGGFGPGERGGFGPGFGGHGHGGFGPGFGPRGPQRARRGDVRAAILSLLADAPSNGYGLIKAIAERTGGAWKPSPGSVYPTLQQLVDEELISSIGEGRRTEFELSEAGRTYVAEHAEELAKAWEATAGHSDSDAAFHTSIGKLMGVVQQFRFAATDEQRAAATEKIDEARRALYLILAD